MEVAPVTQQGSLTGLTEGLPPRPEGPRHFVFKPGKGLPLGYESVYPARDLRLSCRCAHCKSETTGDELLDPRSVPADVRPQDISQVGRYAIHIQWSDGHVTGIYTFQRLRELDQS